MSRTLLWRSASSAWSANVRARELIGTQREDPDDVRRYVAVADHQV